MKLIFCLFILLGFLPQLHAAEYIYYSDQENPPLTQREPHFKTSRTHFKKEFGYLSIRYPATYPNQDKLKMTLSVGNGLLADESLYFTFKKLRLSSEGKPLKILPKFYNEKTKQRENGMSNLLRTRHKAESHLHKRITVLCEDCNVSNKEMILEVEVLVEYLDKEETLKEEIQLYQGKYHV